LDDERRFEINKTVAREQAGYHVRVLRGALGSQRGQRSGGQTEIETDRQDVPRAHTRTCADNLSILVLIGDDLVENRLQGLVTSVYDGQAADLDHVQTRQYRANGRFRSGDQSFVHQRFPHQAGDDVMRADFLAHAAAIPYLAASLKMMVPTGFPS